MNKIVGIVESPYKERFGIPRQPGLTSGIKGVVVIDEDYNDPAYFKGLDSFSYIWLFFLFDNEENSQPTVRPPRLGGKKRVGVFASRSPHRPNKIGLSVVKLDHIEFGKQIKIHISGHDLLDQSRIIDIKPYIEKWDSISKAGNGWAEEDGENQPLEVFFEVGENQISGSTREELVAVIAQDPRPRYQADEELFSTKTYSMKYDSYDVHWRMTDNTTAVVFRIDLL